MPTAEDSRLQAYTKVGIAQVFRLNRYDSWWRSAQANTCAVLKAEEQYLSPVTVTLEADRLDGYKFPSWEAYVAKGENATTPLTAYRERFTNTSGTVAARRKPSLCSATAAGTIVLMESVGMTGSPIKPTPDPRYPHADWDTLSSVADNKARTAFLQSCREQETLFEGLVWAGELPETLAFIRSGWKTLASKMLRWGNITHEQLTKLRRQNRKTSLRKQSKSLSDFLGSSWLALQFGIKPVVSDLEDAASAVLEFGRPQNAKRVKGFGKAELTTTTIEQTTMGHGLYLRHPKDVRRVVKVIYLGAWNNPMASIFSNSTPEFGWNPKTWGLQLDRLVPSIYELIPYSWLLDYFVNLGDVIGALSTRTYNVQWAQRTEVREVLAVVKDGQYFTPFATDEIVPGYVPPTWTYSRKYVTRAQHRGHFYPSWTLQLPGLTGQRWLNVAALVGVKISGHRQNLSFGTSRSAKFLDFLSK